jgi:uncharacterized protein
MENWMRFVSVVSLAVLLCAGSSAQAGFFLDRSDAGVKQAKGEYEGLLPRAQAGNASNAYIVGLYRYFGVGVEANKEEGLALIKQAATSGIVGAQHAMGFFYGSGLAGPADPAEAEKWYAMAEQKNFLNGSDQRLAFSYGGGQISGSIAAIEGYRVAAEKGDMKAALRFGFLLGVQIRASGNKTNIDMALNYFQKAADANDPAGLTSLGVMYANGWGVPKDEAKAVGLFRDAADTDNWEAQENLALMYATGRGVEKNPAEAFKWYMLAADNGMPLAQLEVAWALTRGIGVARDDSQALQWLIRASDRGCSIEASLLGLGVGMLIEAQMPADYQTQEPKYGPCN